MARLQGEIKGLRLPEVFGRIISQRRTGKLRITPGSTQICVYFSDGKIVYATGSESHHRIGAMLVQEGLIAASDRAMVTKMMMPGKRLGEILLQLGKVGSEDLKRVLVKQVLSICTSAFPLESGQYVFNDGAKIPGDLQLPGLSTGDIVMEGVRRMGRVEEIKAALGPASHPPRLTTAPTQISKQMALQQADVRVLSRIDGVLTLREIVDAAPGRQAETYQTLYALRVLGMLERRKAPSTADGRATGASPRTYSGVERRAPSQTDSEQVQDVSDLDRMHSLIKDLDYYDVLGVPDNASAGEIKRAYHQLAKQCHPDRFGPGEGPDAVKKAERVFARITEAYQVLVEDDSRRAYDLAPPNQRVHFDAKAVRRPTSQVQTEAVERWAQGNYEKGMKYFTSRMYPEAVQALSQAAKGNARNVEYALALAWAHARNRATAQEAEKAFVRAVNIDKFNPAPCLQMGKYYMEVKDFAKAKALFNRALALDDHNEEALREISAIDGAQSKKRSIWDKVTGR